MDFFSVTLSHYASTDLVSAGMSMEQLQALRNVDTPLEEKTALFLPFWNKTSNTAYCRALVIAARDLYGVETIDAQSLPELNRRMVEQNKPGLYQKVLQEKCGIRYCVWDWFPCFNGTPEKDDFFRLTHRLDDIVYINNTEDIRRLERQSGASLQTPEALEDLMEVRIALHQPRGLVALKMGLAYDRTLEFEPVSRPQAVSAMERILCGRHTRYDARTLQDYLAFCVARKAGQHNLPLQIHTGLQEGNGNAIQNANPAHLTAMITAHPATRFDLFHGGYPFGGELSAMTKMFPNVWLNMAWLHIISPEYPRRFLAGWLDAVPVRKILGFGGD